MDLLFPMSGLFTISDLVDIPTAHTRPSLWRKIRCGIQTSAASFARAILLRIPSRCGNARVLHEGTKGI